MQTVFPTAYCTADALEDISACNHTDILHHIRASSCQVKQAISHGCSHHCIKEKKQISSLGVLLPTIKEHTESYIDID
jgi:hypothetical protein